jgi:hypothetical protein
MEHKGVQYSVVQTIGAAFKWTVVLRPASALAKLATAQTAILQAIKAIDRDHRQRKAALRKAEREGK